MSSYPFIRQVFLYGLMSNFSEVPSASVIVWFSRSTVISVEGSASTVRNALLRNSSDTVTGRTALFNALFLKMSAKKLDTTTRKPKSASAQAACSRLLPQPKFFPATRILPLKRESFRTKSAFGFPSLSYRQSRNRFSPKPSRVVALRKRAGMIWSVSIFSMGSGTAVLFRVMNFSLLILFVVVYTSLDQLSHVGYPSCDGGCGCHQGAGQEGARFGTLASFEIPV